MRELIALLPAATAPFPPPARARWLAAAAAVTALLWAGDDEPAPPAFGELDADGRLTDSSGHDLWQLAVWLPAGRQAEVLAFLAGHGLEVYRAWKPERAGGGG